MSHKQAEVSLRRGGGVAVLIALLTLGGCPGAGDSINDEGEPSDVAARVNLAPLADAGDDQAALPGAQVFLDGSGVTDPDGDRVVFIWRQIAGPTVALTDPGSSRPRFFAPDPITEATTLSFRLTVTDGAATAVDEISVVVQP